MNDRQPRRDHYLSPTTGPDTTHSRLSPKRRSAEQQNRGGAAPHTPALAGGQKLRGAFPRATRQEPARSSPQLGVPSASAPKGGVGSSPGCKGSLRDSASLRVLALRFARPLDSPRWSAPRTTSPVVAGRRFARSVRGYKRSVEGKGAVAEATQSNTTTPEPNRERQKTQTTTHARRRTLTSRCAPAGPKEP
jgi:hypothetical protein